MRVMTNQWAVFVSHVHLCKLQYNSTGVVVLTFDTDSYSANQYSLTFDTDLSYCQRLAIVNAHTDRTRIFYLLLKCPRFSYFFYNTFTVIIVR